MSPINTARGSALWRESSGSGAVVDAVPAYLVASGADVVFSTVGPETHAFANLSGADYTLTAIGSISPGTPRLFAVSTGTKLQLY